MKNIIFISHATPVDNTFAAWLATKLQLCGYNVWVDINNLSPSDDFWHTIDQTIRERAIKFIFVTSQSSISPDRDGVQKELAVADKVNRQCANFIIPVRIDAVNYGDFPVEILRLNAIDFYNNWANGLTALLEYLEKENVPKSRAADSSAYYLERWNKAHAELRSQLLDQGDEYCSNLFGVDLPPYVYIYYREDVEEILKVRHIPMKKDKGIVITFACKKCLSEWVGNDIEYCELNTQTVLSACNTPNTYLGERVDNLSRDTISLINWTIGEMLFRKGLVRYKPNTQKTSNNVYYFPSNLKAKRSAQSRQKSLSGKYKGSKEWHFGLSGYYTQYPIQGVIFRWHLIFTDERRYQLPDYKQIPARRSKGKRMFNREWKELLQASMYYLAGGSDNIYCPTCCEDNALYINRESQRFSSEKSYIEPSVYRQVTNESEE